MKVMGWMVSLVLAGSAAWADVDVKAPWARASQGPNGALFMVMENKGSDHDKLVSASVSEELCDRMELHTHLHEDGVMKMRQVEAMDVPAGTTTTLEPGGLHVMFMGLKQPLEEGAVIPVSLTFESGKTQTVDVPVKAGKGGSHQGGHHH